MARILLSIFLLQMTGTLFMRHATATPKFPAILILGDSTVDAGNNNYVSTPVRSDHHPYGLEFSGGVATGRFSNGKLVPDMLTSMLGIKHLLPPFLDPALSDDEIRTGVCLASAGSGLDDFTSNLTKAIPVSKQLGMFQEYIAKLKGIAGEQEASKIINDILILISAGTNDFVYNFYDLPTRSADFNSSVSRYQDFIQQRLHDVIKVLKGCCGTGLIETGPLCNPLTPHCSDRSKFLFWDSVHPSETAYFVLAKHTLDTDFPHLY